MPLIRSKAARRDEDREFATDTEAVAELVDAGGLHALRAGASRRARLPLA